MAVRGEAPLGERGIGTLFSDLARETARLFRQEIALAKAELGDHVGRMGVGAALLVGAALVLFAAVLTLIATAILALAIVLPPWLAALIAAVVTAGIGVALALIGRHELATRNLVPRRTLRTLGDDARFAMDHAGRARVPRP